jgi:hypothetical protein
MDLDALKSLVPGVNSFSSLPSVDLAGILSNVRSVDNRGALLFGVSSLVALGTTFTNRWLQPPRTKSQRPLVFKNLIYTRIKSLEGTDNRLPGSERGSRLSSPDRHYRGTPSSSSSVLSDRGSRLNSPDRHYRGAPPAPSSHFDRLATTSPAAVEFREAMFDMYVWTIDGNGDYVQKSSWTVVNFLDKLREQTFTWKVEDYPDIEERRRKSSATWESLACEYADKIFRITDAGISDISVVIVQLVVHGSHDTLLPVTREYTLRFTRETLHAPNIVLTFDVPAELQVVASPHNEILDMRPKVSGSREAQQLFSVRIYCEQAVRVESHSFLDFMHVFAPIRHLLVQGTCHDRRGVYHGDLSYDHLDALSTRFELLMKALYQERSARAVVRLMEPFFTKQYYPHYDEDVHSPSVDEYCSYLRGLIARGLCCQGVMKVQLVVDHRVLRTVELAEENTR